jgi:hypothetical protein
MESPADKCMDMRLKVEAFDVALNGIDNNRTKNEVYSILLISASIFTGGSYH